MRWSGWLRPYGTSWKVACSIPNGVIEIFQWFNPSGPSVVQEVIHAVKERSNRGKGGRCVGLTTLTPSCAECLEVLGALTSWNPSGAVQVWNGNRYFDGSTEKKNCTNSLSLSLSTSWMPTTECITARIWRTVCTIKYFYLGRTVGTKIRRVSES